MTLSHKIALLVTSAVFFLLLIATNAGFNTAFSECQQKNTHDTCFYALYR